MDKLQRLQAKAQLAETNKVKAALHIVDCMLALEAAKEEYENACEVLDHAEGEYKKEYDKN